MSRAQRDGELYHVILIIGLRLTITAENLLPGIMCNAL